MESRNQLFPNMLRAALDRLVDRSPDEISRLGNLPFNGNTFHFQSFGKAVTVGELLLSLLLQGGFF